MKPTLNKCSIACLLALASVSASAQQSTADSAFQIARYKEINALNNVQAYSLNPTRMTRNTLRNVGKGTMDVNYEYGDFFKADGTKHQTDFGVAIEGLRQLGKFDVSGHINYRNYKFRDHRWNNTLFLTEDNPFVYADSVKSEANLEMFDIGTEDAWRINDRLTLGINANLLIGQFTDQADPRPKTDASIVKLQPAAELKLNDTWQVGALAGVDLYRSRVNTSLVSAQIPYTHFLQKGLGDYYKFSTVDYTTWIRDYKGYNYLAAIQLTTTPQGADWQNWLEIHGNYKTEDAADGGSEWEFKGGDYSAYGVGLADNFILRSEKTNHRVTLNADYAAATGKWFGQTKYTDKEHGNREYYEVNESYDIYKSTSLSAKAEYQLDFLKCDIPTLTLRIGAKADYKEMKNVNPEVDPTKQNYTMATVFAGATKHLDYNKWQWSATVDAAYRMALGDPKFNAYEYVKAGKSYEIITSNVARSFAYNAASIANFGLRIDGRTSFARSKIGLNVFGRVNYLTYLGMYDAFEDQVAEAVRRLEYKDVLDGSDRICVQVGFAITF